MRPNKAATTTGLPTTNYSWSGGFLWVRGGGQPRRLAAVVAAADRGDQQIEVDQPELLAVGDSIRLELVDDAEGSLVDYLYAGDSGPTDLLRPQYRRTEFVARVTAIDGRRVAIDRPLRTE
ncbi:MAG TPA: hypothetical protein PKC18_17750, partial [Lacipirellulaceae bacterium]|nr:hypothetical protein [Lacipirellulaceae bacterium]